jgi:hypothetical protein
MFLQFSFINFRNCLYDDFFQNHPFAIDHFASSTNPCQFGANAKQCAIDHSSILFM